MTEVWIQTDASCLQTKTLSCHHHHPGVATTGRCNSLSHHFLCFCPSQFHSQSVFSSIAKYAETVNQWTIQTQIFLLTHHSITVVINKIVTACTTQESRGRHIRLTVVMLSVPIQTNAETSERLGLNRKDLYYTYPS